VFADRIAEGDELFIVEFHEGQGGAGNFSYGSQVIDIVGLNGPCFAVGMVAKGFMINDFAIFGGQNDAAGRCACVNSFLCEVINFG
jgi:hypothetical protein